MSDVPKETVTKTRHKLPGNRFLVTSADGLHQAYGATLEEARARLQEELKKAGKV